MSGKKKFDNLVFLCDWENFRKSYLELDIAPEEFSIEMGLKKMLSWLNSIAKNIYLLMYISSDQIFHFLEQFDLFGFTIIVCRPVYTEEQKKKDTTDEHMTRDGLQLLNLSCGIDCICIGSGDRDFTRITTEAKKRGIKVAIAAVREGALSRLLKQEADLHPVNETPMVYFFSPTTS